MITTLGIILLIFTCGILLYHHTKTLINVITLAVLLLIFTFFEMFSGITLSILGGLWAVWVILFQCEWIRRHFISRGLLAIAKQFMPKISETEKAVLEAGGLGWEAELFCGRPDWKKLLDQPKPTLSSEEEAFLEGPVQTLCEMIDNWEIAEHLGLPENVWEYLKREGFFSMVIPKHYGGKAFSAVAHSQVLVKTASMNTTLGTAVSVPNSLGPAELLLRYGTQEQQDYYLPRLARGEEIPCFALTSPTAGSDAASIVDTGIIIETMLDGKKQIAIQLNFNKRYITLAPIATLIGLAFKLYDPEHLMGEQDYLGITCALLSATAPGIEIGHRHIPLRAGFPNGPIRGKDVIIPLDAIIGGFAMAGQGWRMLMECLGTGRAISLPSMVNGGVKRSVIATGAYAAIRQQFHTAIAHFEGVEEALTRVAANSYLLEATRLFTVNQVDQGQSSAVASAISKYHCTELARRVINDAMDIHGGKGIIMGPRNYLAQSYIETPISITVEGANILTRSLIIFGQGALRCHPYLLKEIQSVEENNLTAFDRALFGHVHYLLSNKIRAFWLALTGGLFIYTPSVQLKRYYQLLSRYAAAFAYIADVTILSLGASLKFKEKLSARLGDMLSYLYMASSVLKFYYDGGEEKDEKIIAIYICRELLYQLQRTLDELLHNFPQKILGKLLRLMVFPWGRRLKPPSDRLGKQVSELITQPSRTRDRLKEGGYFSPNHNNPVGNLEEVFLQIIEVYPLEQKLKALLKAGKIQGYTLKEQIDAAIQNDLMTEGEAHRILGADAARQMAVGVDDFSGEDFA
ncbi:MAG TPA: acyl-CoA dehydrogenase [Coxiellaceae bacterium]|nr:acyl-CoA dehydrogenase [Coxiellaceae bacterium]